VNAPVIVIEEVGAGRRQTQGPTQEAGHLLAVHVQLGAVVRAAAAERDARFGDAVDVVLVNRPGIVAEVVAAGGWEIQGASQERRHLRSCHRGKRTELSAAAAEGDAPRIQPGDVVVEERLPADIDEWRALQPGQAERL
jgi:hypothetical protein